MTSFASKYIPSPRWCQTPSLLTQKYTFLPSLSTLTSTFSNTLLTRYKPQLCSEAGSTVSDHSSTFTAFTSILYTHLLTSHVLVFCFTENIHGGVPAHVLIIKNNNKNNSLVRKHTKAMSAGRMSEANWTTRQVRALSRDGTPRRVRLYTHSIVWRTLRRR